MGFESKSKINKKTIIGEILIAVILIAVAIPIAIWLNIPSNPEDINFSSITVDTAHDMINDNENFPNLIILDVRTQSEYDAGHISNSILIPLENLESRIDQIIEYKNVEILVYCRTGARSANASGILIDNGFTKIYNMEGGITAWQIAGYSFANLVEVGDTISVKYTLWLTTSNEDWIKGEERDAGEFDILMGETAQETGLIYGFWFAVLGMEEGEIDDFVALEACVDDLQYPPDNVYHQYAVAGDGWDDRYAPGVERCQSYGSGELRFTRLIFRIEIVSITKGS